MGAELKAGIRNQIRGKRIMRRRAGAGMAFWGDGIYRWMGGTRRGKHFWRFCRGEK